LKEVIQLNDDGYFVGFTVADESPLEPGVFLLPAGAIDASAPEIPEGKLAKWRDGWIFEDIPQPEELPEIVEEPSPKTYAELRALEYPPMTDYLDGIVKGDADQVQTYIDACLAVKAKYPKPAP
jgi:hypothetical protein